MRSPPEETAEEPRASRRRISSLLVVAHELEADLLSAMSAWISCTLKPGYA